MASSMLEEFSTMLNTRFALNSNPSMSLKARNQGRQPKPPKPVRETITYPKLTVTDANDPCLDPSLSFEHVLSCGHLVTTALPNEPCAPNCYHVADDTVDLDRSLKHKKALKMKNGNVVSDHEFKCDACIETEIEDKIPIEISSTAAEEQRAAFRAAEAKPHEKAVKFRKCYIALKVTSVKCHSDGSLSSRYVPSVEGHPFDTAMPRTGGNMFEDVDPDPVEARVEDRKGGEGALGRSGGMKEQSFPALDAGEYQRSAADGIVREVDGQIGMRLRLRPSVMSRLRQISKRKNDCLAEDEGDGSVEEGEIMEQPAKRSRVVPDTRRSSRNQTKNV